jgi:hypothetical protein
MIDIFCSSSSSLASCPSMIMLFTPVLVVLLVNWNIWYPTNRTHGTTDTILNSSLQFPIIRNQCSFFCYWLSSFRLIVTFIVDVVCSRYGVFCTVHLIEKNVYAVSCVKHNEKALDDSKINTQCLQTWFGAVNCSMQCTILWCFGQLGSLTNYNDVKLK